MGAALCLCPCVVCVYVFVVFCCDLRRDRIHGLPFIHRTRWGRPCVCFVVWCVSVSLLCCVSIVFYFEIVFTAFLSFTGRDGGGPVSVSVCGACLCLCCVVCLLCFVSRSYSRPSFHSQDVMGAALCLFPCVVRVCVSVVLCVCCVLFRDRIHGLPFITGRDGGGPVSVSVCGACLCLC